VLVLAQSEDRMAVELPHDKMLVVAAVEPVTTAAAADTESPPPGLS
jgi:hypothetical protein